MSATASVRPNAGFKAGWILLLIAAALMTLNHAVLTFALDQPVLFIGYTFFNLYALALILLPLRAGAGWAWYTTWLLPVGLALPATMDPAIAIYYYVVAAVCVIGLLLTMRGCIGADVQGRG